MTGSHLHSYENYPPPKPDQPPSSVEPSDPPAGRTVAPTPHPAHGRPQGTGRRTVLGLGAVVGAAAVGLALLASADRGEQADPGDDTSWAGPNPYPDADDGENEYDVAGFTVLAPQGWQAVSATEHRLVLRRSGTTVTFLHYEADQDASALDEARQQLRRYAADVRSTHDVSTADDSIDGVETAEVVLAGTVDDKAVNVVSSVVLTTETYEAAAVVSVVFKGAPSGIRGEVSSMRKDFLDQLG